MFKPITAIASACAIFCGIPTHAQEAQVPLWKSLNYGDTPEAVASKLEAMPEIRQAKVKRGGEVSIRYRSLGGFPILGEVFHVLPMFEGGRLTKVGMVTQPTCFTDVEERYRRFYRVLHEKYPQNFPGRHALSQTDFLDAVGKVNEANPRQLDTILFDDQTAVLFAQKLTRKDAPPAAYTANRSMNAAANALWGLHQQYLSECPRYRSVRIDFRLIYLPTRDLQKQAESVGQTMQEEAQEARDDL